MPATPAPATAAAIFVATTAVASLGLVFVGRVSVVPDGLIVVPLEIVVRLGTKRPGGSIPAPRPGPAAGAGTAAVATAAVFFVVFVADVVVLGGGIVGRVVVAVGYNAFFYIFEI